MNKSFNWFIQNILMLSLKKIPNILYKNTLRVAGDKNKYKDNGDNDILWLNTEQLGEVFRLPLLKVN